MDICLYSLFSKPKLADMYICTMKLYCNCTGQIIMKRSGSPVRISGLSPSLASDAGGWPCSLTGSGPAWTGPGLRAQSTTQIHCKSPRLGNGHHAGTTERWGI